MPSLCMSLSLSISVCVHVCVWQAISEMASDHWLSDWRDLALTQDCHVTTRGALIAAPF